MRIGFFSPTINRIGGGEWVTLNMINSLKSKGHEIVVCSGQKIDTKQIFRVFGRELLFDKEVHFWPYPFDPFDPKSVYDNALKSCMCKLGCEYLIDTFSNNMLPWSNAVYFQGGAYISVLPKGVKGIFFSPFRALLKQSSKSPEYENKIAMACSRFSAVQIEGAVGHKVNVLYPPVSSYFKSNDVTADSREDLIVTVSRFAEEKRLEMVPKIAELAPDKYSFVIVGACRSSTALDSVKESIQSLGVENKVKLMPNLPRSELKQVLLKAKAYLHTNADEPFGISVIEAMSSGCIPIVPNSGGPKEFVPSELRYESVETAASLVELSVSEWSPKKAREFIKASERFSEEKFSDEFLKIMKL